MKINKTIILSFAALGLIVLSAALWWFFRPQMSFREVAFDQLPGWKAAHLQQSFLTFQSSCRAFVKQDPERIVGTDSINLQAKDWQPACQVALTINPLDEIAVRLFFEERFTPLEFYDRKPVKGLFTGYYLPQVKGSFTQSQDFNVPLYEMPKNLVSVELGLFMPQFKNTKIVGRIQNGKLLPYYSREQINKGAIEKEASVLLWVTNPIDRLFLEIQGSGIIELENGERIYIGYDGQNGAPYTSIASVLIKKGVMTRENASMQGIKAYLESHPDERDEVINHNKSFVFFRRLSLDAALGSQGVALTPGYSMAIDREWIPMGAPLWLSTSVPISKNPQLNRPMNRLMIAQDTGGAIRGKVRGDVYWGGGDKASIIAGHMKNEGHYWVLIPRQALSRLN
jgi:membrane-bound lytic murein transglycosylase A